VQNAAQSLRYAQRHDGLLLQAIKIQPLPLFENEKVNLLNHHETQPQRLLSGSFFSGSSQL
jgi:hypothetical protein